MPLPRRTPLHGRRELTHVLVLIPIGLIAAVCVIDVLAPPDIHLGPLLVAAPAITAAFAGPRLTAAIGALAVAAQVFIGIARQVLFTANLQAQIAALVVVSGLVVLFTVVRDRNERRLTQSRSVAAVAQQVLLRPLPARSGALEIASFYLAAEEEAEMGGDLFAAARTTSSTRLIIGDVRGKGLPAYGDAALLLGAFRAAAHRQATLPRLAVHLDGAVRWDSSQWYEAPGADTGTEPAPAPDPGKNDGLLPVAPAPGPDSVADSEETFATAVLLDLPDRWPVLRIINCGHPPPLLLREGQAPLPLYGERTALPIGLGGLAGTPDYEVETFPFAPGDLLLLYTDGVSEARDHKGAFYPLAERAGAWGDGDPQQVLRRLRADLLAHTGGRLGDDAAAVAVRRLPVRSPSPAGGTGAP
ncbi:PP2C family protein-serine/threonine phosphatase [Streptomyces lydicus]|uniref:PP2C family protein-serine/threonine phosphatase n=1 Tax=Streptomyces lydicus TaxID=47763 RepID=UPI0010128354|nr:PP2C family protein-serine/threonine phosphatase [Streptomyces lydicus]